MELGIGENRGNTVETEKFGTSAAEQPLSPAAVHL